MKEMSRTRVMDRSPRTPARFSHPSGWKSTFRTRLSRVPRPILTHLSGEGASYADLSWRRPKEFSFLSSLGTRGSVTKGDLMNKSALPASAALALLLATTPVSAANLDADMAGGAVYPGPVLSTWTPAGTDIGYGFAAQVERFADGGAKPWSVLTVGAQINATNHSGVNQVAFGIATEAWADFGSFSLLTGIEATAINREPNNPWQKVSMWATFKNR